MSKENQIKYLLNGFGQASGDPTDQRNKQALKRRWRAPPHVSSPIVQNGQIDPRTYDNASKGHSTPVD